MVANRILEAARAAEAGYMARVPIGAEVMRHLYRVEEDMDGPRCMTLAMGVMECATAYPTATDRN